MYIKSVKNNFKILRHSFKGLTNKFTLRLSYWLGFMDNRRGKERVRGWGESEERFHFNKKKIKINYLI